MKSLENSVNANPSEKKWHWTQSMYKSKSEIERRRKIERKIEIENGIFYAVTIGSILGMLYLTYTCS